MKFYLGTHRPNWLADTEICNRRIPLFISRKTLANKRDGRITSRITLPRARTSWVLDSGGFSELSQHGQWTIGPVSYVAEVRRCRDEIGMLEWAAPQDWMTENHILDKTGLTLRAHQNRTVRNYLSLREIASDLPFVPVIQGQTLNDYRRCVDIYNKAGVDLSQQSIVGIGSVCRRQATREIELIVTALAEDGLRLHGFGVKTGGFARYASRLISADSMAWSLRGRRTKPGCSPTHLNEANCKRFALAWYDRVISNLEGK